MGKGGKELLILLCGHGRVGKDTFAEMLSEELFNITRNKFVLMAYATELKNRVQRDFDLSYDQLWGNSKEIEDSRYPISGTDRFWTAREILQSYGELYRSIDSNFWINNLFNVIHDKEYKNVIITDGRHPNEALPVVRAGGCIIKVSSNRSNKEKIHGENHISETAMDNYEAVDFEVCNDGSIDDLKNTASQIASLILQLKSV